MNAETEQTLFNFLSQELGATALQTDMQEIERIIMGSQLDIVPRETFKIALTHLLNIMQRLPHVNFTAHGQPFVVPIGYIDPLPDLSETGDKPVQLTRHELRFVCDRDLRCWTLKPSDSFTLEITY